MTYTPIPAGTINWNIPLEANQADLQAQVTTNGASITTLVNLTDALDWQADDMGLLGWAFDPVIATGTQILVSGNVYWVKIPVRKATTITNIRYTISTAGSTLTAGQNFVGLYDASGTRLGISADLAADWAGAPNTRETPLTAPVAVGIGFYYAAFMSNGTTPITVTRGQSTSTSAINMGGSLRYVETTGNVALPASFVPGSANQSASARWAAFT